MGVVGCSFANNVLAGYQSVGGMRLWPPVGMICNLSCTGYNGFETWATDNSASWSMFDTLKSRYGGPSDVWIMICVSGPQGPTAADVQQVVTLTRLHAPGAHIYITGEPLYTPGWTCTLAGPGGPELTDQLARDAASDPSLDVTYAGTFILDPGTTPSEVSSDTCHGSAVGDTALGNQAVAKWGK